MEDQVSYAEWGEEFFRTAVSEQRVLAAVDNLAGRPIEVGPMGVGPGGLAKIRASGAIGAAEIRRTGGSADPVGFRVELPVALDFDLDLQVETQHFHADLRVPLLLTARALTGLRILVEIAPPRAADVGVRLRAVGLRATLTQRLADVEGELRRFVARYVARELDKPYIAEALVIDVASMIDRAYDALPAGRALRAQPAADVNDALAEEIRNNENMLFDDEPGAR